MKKFFAVVFFIFAMVTPVFAGTVSRGDVAEVVSEVVELLEFGDVLSLADMTEDDIVTIVWYGLADIPQEVEWAIDRHGDDWLFEETYDFLLFILEEITYESEAFGVALLRFFLAYARLIPILGIDYTEYLFELLSSEVWTFEAMDERLYFAVAENAGFVQTIEDLVAMHGIDGFIDRIFSLDEFGNHGFPYVNMLLGGLGVADLADKSDLFVSLLDDEIAAEIAEKGERFVQAAIFMMAVDMRNFGIPSDELIANTVEMLNSGEISVLDLAHMLELWGYWIVPSPMELLAQQFLFDEDVTPADVLAVTNALIEFYRDEFGTDLTEIFYIADIGTEDFAAAIWYLSVYDDEWARELHKRLYGEAWLFYLVLDALMEIGFIVEFDGAEFAAMYLQVVVMFGDVVPILGVDNTHDLFDILESYTRALWIDEEVFFNAILHNTLFLEMLKELVAEHGAYEFMEIIDLNMVIALREYADYGEQPQGLIYVDKLLGGLLEHHDVDAILRQAEDTNRWMDLWDDFIDYLALIMPSNFTDLYFGNLEQRFELEGRFRSFYHEITVVTAITDEPRLNLFFQNNSSDVLTFTYFMFPERAVFIDKQSAVVAPNEYYVTQIDFAELPACVGWVIYAFILDEDGNVWWAQDDDCSFEFAFRLTNYPLGHPSHGG